MIKRFGILAVVLFLLLSFVITARGDDASGYRSDLTVLAGNQSMGKLDLSLSDHFQIQAFSQDGVDNLGLRFQLGDWLGIRGGETYQSATQETFPYGGLDFNLPFGTNNLRLLGSYDYNYFGKDWSQYELALRIQMYEHLFLEAGVRGDSGDKAPLYSYNSDKEALLFLRGIFEWTSPKGRWTLDLDPLLYVNGTYLNDYTVKYNFSKSTSFVINANSLYDPSQLNYRAGIQIRF